MNSTQVLLIACAIGGGVHYWHKHQSAVALASVMASADENGFIDVPPAQGQNPDTVYVVAAVNCPHEAAQRADRLAKDLNDQGIPVVRVNNVSFSGPGLDESAVKRLNMVMNGPLPIVFVHGRAKPAATLEDVQAEVRSSGSQTL
jgi:hypothetical protein